MAGLRFQTGSLRTSASVLSVVGRVGKRRLTNVGGTTSLKNVGETAPRHIGVQKPHSPAEYVGLRSPPNLSRCGPFCQLNASTSSYLRVLRAWGEFKFGPMAD